MKDNWNWSRSNLFFGLPFYHTGLRASSTHRQARADGGRLQRLEQRRRQQPGKSVSAQFAYTDADWLLFSALYFGGPERAQRAPEGQPWRHLFDSWVQVRPPSGCGSGCAAQRRVREQRVRDSWWGAGALYAQVRAASFLYLAARGDYFREHAGAERPARRRACSGRATGSPRARHVDARPRDNI